MSPEPRLLRRPGPMLASVLPSWRGHGPQAAGVSLTSMTLTYLEVNGWMLTTAGVTILIDPILEGSLDFGMPDVYTATKRVLPSYGLLETMPPLDALVITQGLDDHAHKSTLEKLSRMDPLLPVIAPPSAYPVLEGLFEDVTYITSRSRRLELPYLGLDALPTVRLPQSQDLDQMIIRPRAAAGTALEHGLAVRATSGALVGPPWQRRENGYLLSPAKTEHGETPRGPSLYLEPHVEYDAAELASLAPVDAIVTPTSGQGLPGFELVHGPEASVGLVQLLGARWVLPMDNGAVDTAGLSASLIRRIGSEDEFANRLRAEGIGAEVLDVRPGQPLILKLDRQ